MIERRQHLGLAFESGQALRIAGQRFGQHLDGDIAFQTGIVGAIHHAHAAFAKLADDLIRTKLLAHHVRDEVRINLLTACYVDIYIGSKHTPMRLTYPTALVLQALLDGHHHGFDVMEATGLPSGTVYPILRRLDAEGCVRSRWEKEGVARQASSGRRAATTS